MYKKIILFQLHIGIQNIVNKIKKTIAKGKTSAFLFNLSATHTKSMQQKTDVI